MKISGRVQNTQYNPTCIESQRARSTVPYDSHSALCQARERDPTAECDDLLPENGRTGMPNLTPFLWVNDLGLAENDGKTTKFQWIIMIFPMKTAMFGGPDLQTKPSRVLCRVLRHVAAFWVISIYFGSGDALCDLWRYLEITRAPLACCPGGTGPLCDQQSLGTGPKQLPTFESLVAGTCE